MQQAAVEVKNVTVKYGNDVILDDISLSVFEKEIFIIIGASGSGKSTLMRQMIGLENPFSGSINISGIDITNCTENEFYNALRKIGVLFQSSALIGSMTIGENVALPIIEFTNFSKRMVSKIVQMKLALVGLELYENYLPSEISGGMKKRAGLARALALNPEFLFLDEPSSGLDPVTAAEIDDLILYINKTIGTTIIIVTHELASIFAVGDRVIMIDKSTKNIIAEGTPIELKNQSADSFVRQFFNRQASPGNEINL